MTRTGAVSVVLRVADRDLRDALTDLLSERGAVVTTAATDASGLDVAPFDVAPFDVAVLDERAATSATCLQALRSAPATRVVALVEGDDDTTYALLRSGAFSLRPATAPADDLADTVLAAARYESTLMPGCARRLVADASSAGASQLTTTMTSTEASVLARLADGASPAQVAASLDVTLRLVGLHTGYAVTKVHHLQRVRALLR